MFIIENNLTLYAQWETRLSCALTATEQLREKWKIRLFPKNVLTLLNKNTFKRDNHTFAGWNTDPNGLGTSYDDVDLVYLDSSVILYAQWGAERI